MYVRKHVSPLAHVVKSPLHREKEREREISLHSVIERNNFQSSKGLIQGATQFILDLRRLRKLLRVRRLQRYFGHIGQCLQLYPRSLLDRLSLELPKQ